MANIKPTQNFVLVQMVSKDDQPTPIILPDGAKDPGSKIKVLAVGPEVPKEPKLEKGSIVILRGDAKHFEAGPGSEEQQIALVDARAIIGIFEDARDLECVPLTDAELDRIIEDTRIG